MTRTRYLLWATKDREIVFGEFGITTRNGYPEFTASFDMVRPFTTEELEDPAEYYENLIDCCFDEAEKYRLCERYDCAPSELADCLAEDPNEEEYPFNMRDCSLYPEIITVGDTDWYFESSSFGQCDTRELMEEYTNKDSYNMLHELWDNYHLKEVGAGVIQTVEQLENQLCEVDEENWIINYIRNNF